jgi:ribonuclease P protein component
MHLPPCELVVVAQPEAASASFAELFRDLTQALKKAGLVQ